MDVFTWQNLWPGALLAAVLVCILFHKPLGIFFRFLCRSGVSLGLLLLWKASGLLPGLALGTSVLNASVIGLLGLPGFGLLLLFRLFPFA